MRILGASLVLVLSMSAAGAQTSPVAAKGKGSATAGTPSPRSSTIGSAGGAPRATNVSRPAAPKSDGSDADVTAIQMDLAWTGAYDGLITGERNDKLTTAVKNFQRSRKSKETGVLNPQERALLTTAARARQGQVGWRIIDDAVTGARLGLPSKQVTVKTESKTGTRWSSAQGQVQIETFRIREPGTTLAQVFEAQRKEPSNRKVIASALKPDFFVLSGMQGLKRFFVRADFKDGEVRGMTVLFDQATEPVMEPAAVAMVGAFSGFPGVAGVAQVGALPRRKVEYSTGIVISNMGHILTDRAATEACNVILVGGHGDATRLAEGDDVALLRLYGAPDLAPAAFAPEPGRPPELTVVGIADPQRQDGGSAVSTASVRLKGDLVEPVLPAGFAGGAALDGQGRLIGMVAVKEGSGAPQAAIVTASAIQPFLAGEHLTSAGAARNGLDAARAALVRVICVRK